MKRISKFYRLWILSLFAWVLLFNNSVSASEFVLDSDYAERISVEFLTAIDGDTVKVVYKDQPLIVRLKSIDAPEGSQPRSRNAENHLKALLKDASQVQLRFLKDENKNTDHYGRMIANVFYNDMDINLKMVEAGMAVYFRKYQSQQTLQEQKDYSEGEQIAKTNKLGIWELPTKQRMKYEIPYESLNFDSRTVKIRPFYAAHSATGATTTTAATDNNGSQAAPTSFNATELSGGSSWEHKVIMGITDAALEMSQTMVTSWMIQKINSSLCDQEYAYYFENFCQVYGFLNETDLDGNIEVVMLVLNKDIRYLPARFSALIMQDQAMSPHWIFALGSILQETSRGVAPTNLIAGITQNDAIVNDCEKMEHYACNLLVLGVLARAIVETLPNDFHSRSAAQQNAVLQLSADKMKSLFFNLIYSQNFMSCHKVYCSQQREKLNALVTPALMREAIDLFHALDQEKDAMQALLKNNGDVQAIKNQSKRINLQIIALLSQSNYLFAQTGLTQNINGLAFDHGLKAIAAFQSGDAHEAFIETTYVLAQVEKLSRKKQTEFASYSPTVEFVDNMKTNFSILFHFYNAKNAEEFKQVVKSVSSPSNMWKMKRSKIMVTFGTLLGAHASCLFSACDKSSMGAGVFMPLGIDLSVPLFANTTAGLFVSAMDLGGIASVRISGDEDNAQVKFSQVLSPGVFLRLGLGRSPFTLGAGVSKQPPSSNSASVDNALRVQVFLAADVSFFAFY